MERLLGRDRHISLHLPGSHHANGPPLRVRHRPHRLTRQRKLRSQILMIFTVITRLTTSCSGSDGTTTTSATAHVSHSVAAESTRAFTHTKQPAALCCAHVLVARHSWYSTSTSTGVLASQRSACRPGARVGAVLLLCLSRSL